MSKQAQDRDNYPLGLALDFLQQIWQLNHALEKLSRRMEKRLGITAQQRLMIRCIGKYPGMTAGRLAGVLHVDPGTVSAALNRLEEKGLLERRQDPRDKRRTCVGLTAKGRAFDCPTDGTVENAVERLMLNAEHQDIESALRVVLQLTVCLDAELGTTSGSIQPDK